MCGSVPGLVNVAATHPQQEEHKAWVEGNPYGPDSAHLARRRQAAAGKRPARGSTRRRARGTLPRVWSRVAQQTPPWPTGQMDFRGLGWTQLLYRKK